MKFPRLPESIKLTTLAAWLFLALLVWDAFRNGHPWYM